MPFRYELDQNSFVHVVKRGDEIVPDINLLDEAELARAKRYLDEKKRQEFITGRTFLKTELAKVMEITPGEVELNLSENGKPYCKQADGEQIHFNLSHGSDFYVLGLSLKPIGVDLERKRDVPLETMKPVLSKAEFAQITDFSDRERSRAILSLFTLKEAFIKATDKKYGLDEISFNYLDGYWQLDSPKVNCSFQHIEHKELVIAVSVDLG